MGLLQGRIIVRGQLRGLGPVGMGAGEVVRAVPGLRLSMRTGTNEVNQLVQLARYTSMNNCRLKCNIPVVFAIDCSM